MLPSNHFFHLHYFISSKHFVYFYHFAFLTIAPNFLVGFVFYFCWFEGFSSILKVNGGFVLRFSINMYGQKMKGREKEMIHFFPLHYSISSRFLFYFYHFAFLTIALNFLFGFVVCFCWFEGLYSILQVNGEFFSVQHQHIWI